MMDYEEFGRSGTAPSMNSKGVIPSQRVRPQTRGVVAGTGASELADLNLSLKMDKRIDCGNSGAHCDVSDDRIEGVQSVVESWERARHIRQTAELESDTAESSNKSVYTGGDPVSAAYFITKTPTGRGIPRVSQDNKERAVAEQAENGIQRSCRTGKSTTTAFTVQLSTGTDGLSRESTPSRPSSRSGVRPSTAGPSKRKVPIADSAISPADRPSASSGESSNSSQLRPGSSRPFSRSMRTSTLYEAAGGAASGVSNTWSLAADMPPCSSLVHSSTLGGAETGPDGSSGTVIANSTAAKSHLIPSPPAAQIAQSSISTCLFASSNDQCSKSSFRRRSDKYRAVSAGRGSRQEEGASEQIIYSMSSTAPSSAITVVSGLGRISPDGVVAESEADILDTVSPSIEIDYDGSELTEKAECTTTPSFAAGELQRPQSRKLYLGSAGTPSNVQNRVGVRKAGSISVMDGNSVRPPRSAGATLRHCMSMSPEQKIHQFVDGGGKEVMIMATNSSFGGFVHKSSPRWKGKDTSVNYDDRPPSRQRSAFPTHLADVDVVMGRGGFCDKKLVYSDVACWDQEIPGVEASVSPFASGIGLRSARSNYSSCEQVETLNDRPPSRQTIRALNLFDNAAIFDGSAPLGGRHSAPNELEVVKPEPMENGSIVDMGFVSPVLMPSNSCVSVGIVDVRDDADSALTSPPPRVSRSAFDASSMGPVYDPIADGFTQLERSTTAPFKIRYNMSTTATGGNHAHSTSNKEPTSKKEPVTGFMWRKVGVVHDMGHSTGEGDDGSQKMGVSQSTPSLHSPGKRRVPPTESDCDWVLRKSASSSDRLPSEDGGAFLRMRDSHPDDYLDEELTVMMMHSEDGSNDSSPDMNDLMLGSSLGEDFLNLFARGGQ